MIYFSNEKLTIDGGWQTIKISNNKKIYKKDDVRMDLRSLLMNAKLAEIEFLVEGEKVPGHLGLLSVRCPALIEIIESTKPTIYDENGNFKVPKEKQPVQVPIDNIKYLVFTNLMEYIYTGTLTYTDLELIVYLRSAATRFGLPQCKKLAAYQIKKHLCLTNVLSVLQSAYLCNEIEVKEFAFNFIAENYDDIALSDKIKELNHELLVEFLRIPTKGFQRKKTRDNDFDTIGDVMPVSSLKDDLSSLVGSRQFADIQFIIQGTTIYAHHCILFARNPVFSRLWFEGGMIESVTRQVVIDNVSVDIFKQLLIYIYSGNVQLSSVEQALDLICVSDRYFIDTLKTNCESYITSNITNEDVLDVLQVAENCRLYQLKDLCLSLIVNNISILANKEAELLRLPQALVVSILLAYARTSSTIKSP